MDLSTSLPKLLQKAVIWVQDNQADILSSGSPLSTEQMTLARLAGVKAPENIRIKLVDQLPLPKDPDLAVVAEQMGLSNMSGLTLFYGIFVCKKVQSNSELILHECRHVYQYEQHGSISAFLQEYLLQISTVGYWDAPLEQDARNVAAKYN